MRCKRRQKTPGLKTQDFNSLNQKALISSGTYWVPGERSLENKNSMGFKSLRNMVLNTKRQGDLNSACLLSARELC